MMLFQQLHTDERARSSTRYAAAIWLGVIQVLLAGVVFYRLYVLGQPDEQIRDFQAVLAGTIVTGCLLIYGWPQASEWANTWLPALLGPAILVGAYMLVAHLGQWRIERQIERMKQ